MARSPESSPPVGAGRVSSGTAADVDAYLLESGDFLLFAHLKEETEDGHEAFLRHLAGEHFAGNVAVIGRAWKTPARSAPLAPIWMGPGGRELFAVEHGLAYALEVDDVLNPGLFLDQADNRLRLRELVGAAANGRTLGEDDGVLNLFSYSGSFSISALAGGAAGTTSVDVSARYLAWERRNWEKNFALAGASHPAPRLIKDDARDFLRRVRKRGARHRFVVIDPPTFSRGKGKAFRVKEELPALVEAALDCWPSSGPAALLASTNDAGFFPDEFLHAFDGLARHAGARVERGAVPESYGDTPAKSAWLLRDA
jgi:23S rRNA G2069 N7-methylase RlmK/C1962 C5-methylase RlmI